jgi:hypothetical protein
MDGTEKDTIYSEKKIRLMEVRLGLLKIAENKLNSRPLKNRKDDKGNPLEEYTVTDIYKLAEKLEKEYVGKP